MELKPELAPQLLLLLTYAPPPPGGGVQEGGPTGAGRPEDDAEAKQGSKGRPQRYNQGAYAMATQSQTPTHQSTYVQPQQSLHDDEALAHRHCPLSRSPQPSSRV